MAAGLNRVVLIGNLTRDPRLKYTQGGTAVCELGIAVNGREKGPDGTWRDRADFFDAVAYGPQAEACGQNLAKGRPVALDGRLRLERWEKDGEKHSRVRVVADHVELLPTRDGDAAEPPPDPVPAGDFAPSDDDDIPF